MAAGASAAAERDRSLALAGAHERAAAEARRRARGFAVAATTEPQVATALESLVPRGFALLHDRRWPGTRQANLDHIAVGPGGVLVIDTKAWRGTVRLHRGSLLVNDEARDDAVDAVIDQARAVEDVLCDLGLAPLEVVPVLCFVRQGHVEEQVGRVRLLSLASLQRFAVRRGRRLDPAGVARVAAHLESECPPAGTLRLPPPPIVPPPVAPRGDTVHTEVGLFSDEQLHTEAIEAARQRPVEDWMVFLHLEQAGLVRRSFSGPCRVRGPVGTGKTVVALHRAAYLAASRPGPILFTSYVRTLPVVMRELYRRLAPDTVDRVEFVGLHAWAKRLLDERGIPAPGTPWSTKRVFNRVYRDWPGRDELATRETPRDYWRDEVDAVIKGRGLVAFEQYADLRRVGRRTRLTPGQRALVWDLFVAYDRALRADGVCDHNDLLAMALRSVEEDPPHPGYRAVIADEVQDLNLIGIKLLHALVGDAPDGLTLVGDGQQAVYPGGFSLAEAGVSVAGRATVLRVNYRNTRQVLAYASDLVAEDDFDDLAADLERGRREVEVLRTGPAPIVVRPAGVADHDRMLLAQLRRAQADGVRLGDMAVLARTKRLVDHYVTVLKDAGVPVVRLERYDGVTSDKVKVGTVKRSKGLEFAQVFLPQVSLPAVGVRRDDSAEAERLALERRECFVAMTRARDLLWVGVEPPADRGCGRQRQPSRRSEGIAR